MINLWSIAQMVLELLTCPFVHGQLWRNIAGKKIRKKTKRIREWSIFPSFQAFDYGANVRSFPACMRVSKWLIMNIILSIFTFSLLLFGSFREVSKMWKGDLRQVYVRMLHNYNPKNTYFFISFAKREEDFSNAKCSTSSFDKFYMIIVYCMQKVTMISSTHNSPLSS